MLKIHTSPSRIDITLGKRVEKRYSKQMNPRSKHVVKQNPIRKDREGLTYSSKEKKFTKRTLQFLVYMVQTVGHPSS